MQKLARDYLNELNKRHKKNRRALVAWILMAVLVVGGVMGTLAQYGFADDTVPTEARITEAAAQVNEDIGSDADVQNDGAGDEIQEPEGQPSLENTDDGAGDENGGENAGLTGEENNGDEQNGSSDAAGDVTSGSADGTSAPAGTEPAETGSEASTSTEQTGAAAESTTAATEMSSDATTESAETSAEPTTETMETEMTSEAEDESEEVLSPEVNTTQKIDGSEAQIHVYAGEGVLPEGTQLSVKPIVKKTEEELERLSAEERKEAEAINATFDEVQKKLEASAEKKGQKELLHFEAFDISFLANDENGEPVEIHQPDGDVDVTINFPDGSTVQAFSPEKALEGKAVDLNNVDIELVHMKETPEVLENAGIDGVKENKTDVSRVRFTSDSFSVYAITWMGDVTGFTYENEDVTISVTEETEGAIPKHAELNVVPILKEGETQEKYFSVAEKLREKAEKEGYEIAGFLAYDISFIDREGTKTEPNGQVKVEIEYQNPSIPEEVNTEEYSVATVSEEDTAAVPEEEVAVVQPRMQTKALSGITAKALNSVAALNSTTLATEEITEEEEEPAEKPQLGITVMHLEEDENGNVTDVVNMGAEGKINALDSTENQEVTKTEFVTDSFSTFVITWTYGDGWWDYFQITVHYVSEDGKELTPQVSLGNGVTGNTSNNSVIDLNDYIHPVLNYSFDRIVMDNRTSGTQIGRLRYTYTYDYYRDYIYKIQRDNSNGNSSWQNKNWSGNNSSWTDWLSSSWGSSRSGDIYIIYKPVQSQTPGSQASAPAHRKYIKKNSADNYTLTLDVTGKQDAARPIDVLLIVDQSNSMDQNRRKYVNDAIGELKTSLLSAVNSNAGLEVNLGVVTFSGPDSGNSSDTDYKYNDSTPDAWEKKGWTQLVNESSFDWSLNNVSGGTNWQAGVKTGESMLAKRPADDRKYVIFITDGNPTFRYYEGSSTTTQGTGGNLPTTNTTQNNNYINAVNEWNSSPTLQSTVARYVVDATGSDSPSDNLCDEFAKAIGATELSGSDSDNMAASFRTIAGNIINPGYTDVKITDTLSEYADFDIAEDGTVQYTVVRTINGQSTPLAKGTNPGQYEIETDLANKTFTLDLSHATEPGDETQNGKLENDAIYSISFNVKPTQKAADDYIAEDGYIVDGKLVKGDLDTDAPDVEEANHTSSDKEGFYSNDAENTKLTYTYNNGEPQNADYPKPVIQVNPSQLVDIPTERNPVDGSITKTMGTVTEDGKYPINLEVKTRLEEEQQDAKVDVILVIDVSTSMNNNSRLTNTKNAAKAFVESFVGTEGVNANHQVGIVTFGTTASRQLECTGDATTVLNHIKNLSAPYNNGTNADDGFRTAMAMAESSPTANKKYVIFLTDGVPTYYGNKSGKGDACNKETYNAAVSSANALKEKVDGIYTIGLVDGMSTVEKEIARTFLASNNSQHCNTAYTACYEADSITLSTDGRGNSEEKSVTWDRSKNRTYSDGYFEIGENSDTSTALKDIWIELATIMNNLTKGSTGNGWIVTDTMADYTNFLALNGAEINGYTLTVSPDGKKLTTTLGDGDDATEFTVAEYVPAASEGDTKGTITWHLNSDLATKSRKYGKGTDYTYNLTYYVDFNDSGNTELRNTNTTTYIEVPGQKDKIYPDEMPYFINVVGSKMEQGTQNLLDGAEFAVYRNADGTDPIVENISIVGKGDNRHFAFQIGQSDLDENGTMTVYLKETKAPDNYTQDMVTHPIAITVSNVRYRTAQNAQADCIKDQDAGKNWGQVESATVGIAHNSHPDSDGTAVESDLLTVSENELKLLYANAHKDPWGIIKRNGATGVALSGAKFELYRITDTVVAKTPSYEATSDANGMISKWIDLEPSANRNEVDSFNLTGRYELHEASSPEGYAKSEEVWIVEMVAGTANISVKDSNVKPVSVEGTPNYYYFDNVLLYELPSTGGIGIYWYMISGMLLMMAGALILYNNKRVRGC